MADQRNRILKLRDYLEKENIIVNIGKNKARGHKGFFTARSNLFRIDIAKNQNEESVLATLIHEYSHYIHYKYNKSLTELDFIFPNLNDDLTEELIKISVESVPKETAKKLYDSKNLIKEEIQFLYKKIKQELPDFKLSSTIKKFEKELSFPFKYLLKYDKIKINNKIYSIEILEKENSDINDTLLNYVKLKSKQRHLKRINFRIQKINNYYNQPTELISRFIEIYFTNYQKSKIIAPMCTSIMDKNIKNNIIPEFTKLNELLK